MAQQEISPGFEFIDVSDRSDAARSHNERKARSHASKVSRRKQVSHNAPARLGTEVPGLYKWPVAKIRTRPRLTEDVSEDSQQLGLYLPRPVSPTFGALRAATFSPGATRVPGETLDYYFQYVLGNFMARSEIGWYFQAYCELPIVFHALAYSAANHQDRARGVVLQTSSPDVITHKVKAIRHLSLALSQLGNCDIEPVLMAMTCLWRKEPEPDQLQPDQMTLFRPHLPSVNGVNIYGRGRADQTDPLHRKAMDRVFEHADILALKSTGMSKAVAGHDLIVVSQALSRPRLPNVWTSKSLIASIMLGHGAGAGKAFVDQIPGGLPAEMLSALTYAAALDRELDHTRSRRRSDDDLARLRSAINDVHHRIMSLRTWQDLDDREKAGSYLATYECCRLTAMLYSSAVLFPLPVASGWHIRLLQQLRVLLETARMQAWVEDTSSLLLWSSYIACITAYETSELAFSAELLRHALHFRAVTTLQGMREIVQDFLWTDSACGSGAEVVWLDLELGAAAG